MSYKGPNVLRLQRVKGHLETGARAVWGPSAWDWRLGPKSHEEKMRVVPKADLATVNREIGKNDIYIYIQIYTCMYI